MERDKTTVWLTVATFMPLNYQEERFYYDAESKELFIIALYDYLLLENEDGCFEYEYDEDEITKLTGKLLRLEENDPTIHEIPRVPVTDRISLQLGFLARMNESRDFLQLKEIVKGQVEQDQLVLDTVINEEGLFNSVLDDWDSFKAELVDKIGADFEGRFNVKLDDLTIWQINKSRAVRKVKSKVTVTQDTPTQDMPTTKAWWQFW